MQTVMHTGRQADDDDGGLVERECSCASHAHSAVMLSKRPQQKDQSLTEIQKNMRTFEV